MMGYAGEELNLKRYNQRHLASIADSLERIAKCLEKKYGEKNEQN